jgi:hypothetical protein
VKSHPSDQEDTPPASRETIVNTEHLHRENDTAHRTTAMTNQSCQPLPPRTNRVTRSQFRISRNALIIMAKGLASTPINSYPFTYAEAIDSRQ